MKKISLFWFVGFLFMSQVACASLSSSESVGDLTSASAWRSGLYHGTSLQPASIRDVIRAVTPGTIVIVSENHGYKPHHNNQLRVLQALDGAPHAKVSVGMEFFSWKKQPYVDQYVRGEVSEDEFLKLVEWGGDDFSNYRDQVLFPRDHNGETLALNAPRQLTARIAEVGLAGLTPRERTDLPPGLTLGRAEYFERFTEVMKDHVPADALSRYFEAQSVWDDTMAWVAMSHMVVNPDQILVIIVGDFHASYGGGLPDRLRARGAKKVVTISQVNLTDVSDEEASELLKPHAKWGPRGQFVWVERDSR